MGSYSYRTCGFCGLGKPVWNEEVRSFRRASTVRGTSACKIHSSFVLQPREKFPLAETQKGHKKSYTLKATSKSTILFVLPEKMERTCKCSDQDSTRGRVASPTTRYFLLFLTTTSWDRHYDQTGRRPARSHWRNHQAL